MVRPTASILGLFVLALAAGPAWAEEAMDKDAQAAAEAAPAPAVAATIKAPAVLTDREKAEVAGEVGKAFDQAVKQHATAAQELASLKLDESVAADTVKGFKAWKTLPFEGKIVLNRAAAMEDLCGTLSDKASAARLSACIEAAAKYLTHKDAAYRAVACEFLAHFPQQGLESGLAPAVAGLLEDQAAPFEGVSAGLGQCNVFITRIKGGVKVSDLADLALTDMTGFHFDTLKAFRTWWGRNQDYRNRLWYWSLRWRGVRPGQEESAAADVAALAPDKAFRLMLLAGNGGAVLADAGLPPEARSGSDKPWPIRERGGYHPQFSSKTIADFVQKHGLKGVVMAIVRQDPPWPEAKGEDALRGLFYSNYVLPVLPLILERGDAADIAKEVENPRGVVAGEPSFLAGLAEVLVGLDPQRVDGILVAQLQRRPGQPLMAAQLVRCSGLKHWDLVQAACPHGIEKQSVIPALGQLRTPQAAAALGQWMNAEDWTPNLNDDGYETDSGPEFLMEAFVKAAATLNGGKPVIGQDLLGRAHWRGLKGWTAAETREANKPVPAARAEVVAQLKAFFAKAAASPTEPAASVAPPVAVGKSEVSPWPDAAPAEPAAPVAPAAPAEPAAAEAAFHERLKEVRLIEIRYLRGGDPKAFQEGREKILAIEDSSAVGPLVHVLYGRNERYRGLLIEALGQHARRGSAAARAYLQEVAVGDSSAGHRRRAVDALREASSSDAPPATERMLAHLALDEVGALRDRAASALAALDEKRAVWLLVERLVTEDYKLVGTEVSGYSMMLDIRAQVVGVPVFRQVQVQAAVPGAVATTTIDLPQVDIVDFATTVAMAGRHAGPDYERVEVRHPEILKALKQLTGKDFGYDPSAWRRWLQSQPKGIPAWEPIRFRADGKPVSDAK